MLTNRIKIDFEAAYKSIKLPEVEEWFDIYFSRFFGYYLARLSLWLGLSAHQVSIISLITGSIAGVLFYYQDNLILILWACFFITISGLFDSADGQLARMTQTSSDLGRKVDAIIDTVVFIVCYVSASLYFHQYHGWYIYPVAVLAGWLHSIKSSVYEFYKSEFVFYIKQSTGQRIAYLDEVKANPDRKGLWNGFLYYVELDYTRKQAYFISRNRATRLIFEKWAFGENQEKFRDLYRRHNQSIMTWWALVCGTNVHRTAIMVCSLFGRMDVYFVFAIVTYLPMILVNRQQKRNDILLVREMEVVQDKIFHS
jgi:phosphatidylglycerophosphate synthase